MMSDPKNRFDWLWLLKNKPGKLALKLACLSVAIVMSYIAYIPSLIDVFDKESNHYGEYGAILFFLLLLGILLSVVFESFDENKHKN
jgi:hypothetical protein